MIPDHYTITPDVAKSESAYAWGVRHGSCPEALEQRHALGPEATQIDWWRVCPRGDWLIWQAGRLPAERLLAVLPALLRAVNRIVDRAVRDHALPCAATREWAERWLSGEDRTWEGAEEAAMAAVAARAAEAAAWAAEEAAWAAEEADEASERARQAADVRAEIPEWPGEEAP
jgi:hypothetical protein